MQIKSVEALKSWLTTRLESVCDADPAALAKYVVALVKKDKPVEELKDICVDQLEVFLSSDTTNFVNMLFEALTNFSYMPQTLVEPTPGIAVPTTPKVMAVPTTPKVIAVPTTPKVIAVPTTPKVIAVPTSPKVIAVPTTPKVIAVPTTPKVISSQPAPNSTTPPETVRKSSISEDVLTPRVLAESSVLDDDDRDFKRTRRTTDSSDRSTSGSSSVVSSSGDRSRKRRADDEGRGRSDFSKFAKEETGGMRRGDSEPRDDQAPRIKPDAAPYDNVTYPIPSAMLRDRSNKYLDSQEGWSGGMNSQENLRGRHGSPSWDRRGGRMGRGRPFRDRYRDDRLRHGGRDERERGGARKSRCRDYDEKGFCMRGELCPFDHGNDPVVVQDVIPPGMLGFPDGQAIPGTTLPGNAVPIPGNYPAPTSQPPPPGTAGTLPNDAPKAEANLEGPDTSVPVSGPRPPAPSRMVLQHSQAPVMPLPTVHMIQQPMLRGQAPRPPFGNPFEDSYNPEQPQFDRAPVWMRLGNGRPPHPLPPQGVFHPVIGLRSRELLAVTPNPPQLTVRVPGMAAPGPRMPPMPDRIVIHSEPQKSPPVPPQEQPPPPQQPSTLPKQGVMQAAGSTDQTAPVKSRLGFPKKLSDTLELKKIPRDMNNIAKLNEHFQRFGTITNIQVCAFGDPEAALVQFSHHQEAKAAYSCPDAVLSNRFIRVFWYNPDRHQNNKDGNSNQGAATSTNSGSHTPSDPTAKENSDKPATEPKAKPTMFQSGKTTFSKTAKAPSPHIPASPALTKRQQELHKQEAMKKKLEIQKQKQELLNKQIQEQKLLISKLEKKNLSTAEKELIIKTIKNLSSNIEAQKKEVELAAMAAKSKESPSQARQIAQKAILDQELDLITHQNTGEDTTELKKKVEELKQEAKSLGLLDPPTKGRGRGAVRGRGRGTPLRSRPLPRTTRVWTRESASLDHRPKQITVTEITPEQKEDTAEHFKEFGIVDNEEYIEEKNTLNLTFRTRKEAEIAYNKGKTYKGRALKISWYRPPGPPPLAVTTPTTPTTPTALKKVEEELGLDMDELGKHEFDPETEEALLLGEDFDEEEEEEDERSWKR